MHHLKRVLTLLLLSGLLSLLAAPAGAQTIHDVVSATWPQELVPTAEQIKYHEGGPYFNDGYCGFGIIPSTQAVYGSAYGLDPYECSAYAYQIYLDVGSFAPWTTYGWYTYGAGSTPVSYY